MMVQSRFHKDEDGDLHEQILRIEAYIEELADVVESCRKIILVSKFAAGAGGIPILAIIIGAIGFNATFMIGAITAVVGGTRFWVKREYLEANYDRHESRRGTQSRVDQQNGSSGGRRRGGGIGTMIQNQLDRGAVA